MTRRTLAQLAAISGLLAGCGGGGSSKPLTESDFCSQKADAECQVTDQCVTDKDACKQKRMMTCTAFVAQAKASGKRVFVPGNIGTCVSKTKNVYSMTTQITPSQLADMDDACNYVFQGAGKVNVDMCDVKYDCKDRVICDKGFCAMSKSVTTTCGNPGDTCPTGQYCAANASNIMVCMPKGMSGDTCSAAVPCTEDLRCAAGKCTDRVGMAGACTSNDDCSSVAPFCDPYAGNKCDKGLSFSAGSTSCGDFGGTSSTGTGGTGGGTGGAGGSGGGTGGGGGGGTGGASGGRGGAGGSAGGGTGGSGTGGSGAGGTGGSGTGGTTGTGGAGGVSGVGGVGGLVGTGGLGVGDTTGVGGGAGA